VDPDACLAEIRELAKSIMNSNLIHQRIKEASDLAVRVEALDEWMSTGGFLPEDWAKGRPSLG